MSSQTRTYQFGPLERRGLLLGLRVGHLVLIAGGGGLVLLVLSSFPSAEGAMTATALAVGLAAAGIWPVMGRTLEEWAPVAARFAVARVGGTTRWVAAAQRSGQLLEESRAVDPAVPPATSPGDGGGRRVRQQREDEEALDEGRGESWIRSVRRVNAGAEMPPYLRGVRLLGATWGQGEIGVIHDTGTDRYSGIVAVQGRSFALLDGAEQDRRLEEWGDLLADLGREGGHVVRLQWINRTVPDDSESVVRDFGARRAPGQSAAVSSYLALLDTAGPTTQQHEVYLVLTISARQAARAIRSWGGRERGACEVVAREVDAVASRLMNADVTVRGVLGLRMVAGLLRVAVDPQSRAGLAHRAAAHPDLSGAAPESAWPQASVEEWATFRTDGAYHRTYWISEWPRVEVRANFFGALILRTRAMRTVSVVMHVEPPSRALRRVEAQVTDDATTTETRQRLGFRTGQRRQREHQNVTRREEELTDGHGAVTFSGYITVTAASRRELEAGCADIEQAARGARLDVRPEYGSQAMAFTYTLPLGRGLR